MFPRPRTLTVSLDRRFVAAIKAAIHSDPPGLLLVHGSLLGNELWMAGEYLSTLWHDCRQGGRSVMRTVGVFGTDDCVREPSEVKPGALVFMPELRELQGAHGVKTAFAFAQAGAVVVATIHGISEEGAKYRLRHSRGVVHAWTPVPCRFIRYRATVHPQPDEQAA